MNDAFDDIYLSSITTLDDLKLKCSDELSILENLEGKDVSEYQSAISPVDIILPMLYGILGGVISSSEAVEKFCSDIHDSANQDNPNSFWGKLLRHHKDAMDNYNVPDCVFTNRGGEISGVGFHRLMYGHDPFSPGPDNPFFLMIRENGICSGIFKVFQHLIADTFSKQGLPVPFHSIFDFYGENGKLSNGLLDLAKKAGAEAREAGFDCNVQNAFSNLFTIKFSDIAATGLTWALCEIHIALRKIDDPIMISQTKIIGYSAQFFSRSIIMWLKTGVPAISWPTLPMLLKEIYKFYRANWQEIHHLESKTKELVEKNKSLEQAVFLTGKDLPSYNNAIGYIEEYNNAEKNIDDFINSF